MAEGKKSFVLYADLIHTVNKMPSEKAGELFKHILSYVNDEEPKTDDLIIQLTFEPIKQQLKRDLDKWGKKIAKQSEAGVIGNLKRWNADIYARYEKGEITLEESQNIAEGRKASLPDSTQSHPIGSIADNVNVNVNDNDINNTNVVSKETIDFDLILKTINETFGREFRTINASVKAKYKARLKEGYKIEDVLKAINNCSKDSFHKENNYKYATIEYFSRPNTLDRFNQDLGSVDEFDMNTPPTDPKEKFLWMEERKKRLMKNF